MLAQERHAVILEMLRQRNIIKISDIAGRFGVSNLTARRDLDALQEQGLIRRVYGGAVLAEQTEEKPKKKKAPYPSGLSMRQAARGAAIAEEAARMVHEGDRIFLGYGVTVEEIARRLQRFRQLNIVTGSLAAVRQLINSGHEIYVLGGRLHHDERHVSGSYAVSMAKDFHTNIAFIPCGGVSVEYGVMSDYLPAAELGRAGVENAEKVVLLLSSSQFGRVNLHSVCPLSAIDVIITDDGITAEQRDALEAQGVEVVVVEAKEDE